MGSNNRTLDKCDVLADTQQIHAKPGVRTLRDLRIGDEFFSGLQIVRIIRSGGMGVVYILLDLHRSQIWAAKTFLRHIDEDLFIQEANAWVKLGKHTNVVFALFAERFHNRPFIFMEYVDGGDLQHIGKLRIPHVLDLAIQFCNGMSYASGKHGLIHRDIKPANILVDDQGVLKVTDFGIARAISAKTDLKKKMGDDEAISYNGLGTPRYRPPEQFPPRLQEKYHFVGTRADVRSDIYSFGATFYELLSGKKPFESEGQVFEGKPISICQYRDVPKAVDILLRKCLEKNPFERFGSFDELQGELIDIYNGLPSKQKIFGDEYIVRGGEERLSEADLVGQGILLSKLGINRRAVEYFDKALDCEQGDLRRNALVGKGRALAGLGRYELATKCFDEVLGIGSKTIQTMISRGNAKVKLQEYEEALDCYDEVLKTDPNNGLALFNKRHCLAKVGRYDEAEECDIFDEVSTEIMLEMALYYKWKVLRELGKRKEATECFDEFVRISEVCLFLFRGEPVEQLIGERKYREVIDLCDKALEANPSDVWHLGLKGMCFQYLGEHEKAVDCFDLYLRLATRGELELQDVLCLKGLSLLELGRDGDAIRCLDEYQSHWEWLHLIPGYVGPERKLLQRETDIDLTLWNRVLSIDSKNITALLFKGDCLAEKGSFADAIECYGRVLKTEPSSIWALRGCGDALAAARRYEEALRFYTKGLAAAPESRKSGFLLRLGGCLAHMSRDEEAIECYDRAIGEPKTKRWQAVDALVGKAEALLNRKNYERAMGCYDEALENYGTDGRTLIGKGYALAKLMKSEEAVSCYSEVLSMDLERELALFARGYPTAEIRRFEKVIDYFDAKVQLDPKNAEAWFSKALAEEKLGRHETAIHSYTRFCNFVSSEAAGLIELAQQRIRALT